ncbi:hypothetical protein Ciccas_002033 [Cichlidogyrus casuarinus]|uniref:EGF-like domain-containing protein n=1 Tax=Cichlidogyrus casuarinus TaxID=1844966 RepID=A0ABD2QID7_9PLAT
MRQIRFAVLIILTLLACANLLNVNFDCGIETRWQFASDVYNKGAPYVLKFDKRTAGDTLAHHKIIRKPRLADTVYKDFETGFPPHIYASKILPTLQFMSDFKDKWVPTYGYNGAHFTPEIDFRPLNLLRHFRALPGDEYVRSCNEAIHPHCAWGFILNYYHIFEFSEHSEMFYWYESVGGKAQDAAPIIRGDCYPFTDWEALSVIHTYLTCTSEWNNFDFDRNRCPNTCKDDPCSLLANAVPGTCQRTGFHENEFTCSCFGRYVFALEFRECILDMSTAEGSQCAKCDKKNTQICELDSKTGNMVCTCKAGYAGASCSREFDPCIEKPVAKSGIQQERPIGRIACALHLNHENQCHPQLMTEDYACLCAPGFQMDSLLPYDNCLARIKSCSSIICQNGRCMNSPDGSLAVCICDPGWKGRNCDQVATQWSDWSTWSHCLPLCAKTRQRLRMRTCLSITPEDCIGSMEQVETCDFAETLPRECFLPLNERTEDVWRWFAIYSTLGVIAFFVFALLFAFALTFFTSKCVATQTAYSYTLVSCDDEETITTSLPSICAIDAKLDFGTGACPTYRIKCTNEMTKETKTKVAKAIGDRSRAGLALQEDPIVKNIVVKSINPISDGSVAHTSAGYDNNFGPLLAANIRGQGIQVVLLDDGLQVDHPDLATNVDHDYTWNLSGEQSLTGSHGTSCAGLIAAVAENANCIVGGAPLAKLGIVKMIGYQITASEEAQALMSFLQQGVHVYSNSWGPADDGQTTGGPSLLTLQAIQNGITNVREAFSYHPIRRSSPSILVEGEARAETAGFSSRFSLDQDTWTGAA